jgi:hypothetical protein
MRKGALLLAVLLAASLTTAADAKKRKAAAPDPAIAANKNAADFIRDAVNPYWATSQSAKPKKMARHHRKGKSKKA